jgi:2-polyprenyl-3-methyl-5-hydroxy-6-metoxy-1,4-benzoquinol methylase
MEKCNSNIDCTEQKLLLFSKNGYPIVDCKKCVRRFAVIRDVNTHLSQVYSDDYFFEGKDGYPNYLEEKDILINYGVHYAEIIRKYINPGKVLDIGCAAGFILKGFESLGWQGYGIEPNETMANYGRSELNLDIQTGSLETYSTENKFDLITLIQVIGHLYDVDKALENISHLLNHNGLVLVESWNMKSLAARILGKHWHEYSPPSVINWFSDKSLNYLFSNYGFKIIASGFPAKRINLQHALSLLDKNSPNIIYKKKIFGMLGNSLGRLVINYPPVDLKWYLFRKQ